MSRAVYLHSFAHHVGAAAPIASIEPIARDETVLEFLLAMGLRDYRRSDQSPWRLAAASARATLERAGMGAGQIGGMVYASTSFQQRSFYVNDLSELVRELELWHVSPLGVTLSECGNFAAALRVASALVRSGEQDQVLLVTADVCPGPEARLIPPTVSVLSDGAASCIVSAERRGFEVLSVRQVSNHRVRFADPSTESVRVLRYNAEGARRAARAAMVDAGVSPPDLASLVPNNLTRSVLELFAAQCEVPFDRVYTARVAELGHVYACDAIINLDAAAPAGTHLVLSNGTCTWGAAVVRGAGGGQSA